MGVQAAVRRFRLQPRTRKHSTFDCAHKEHGNSKLASPPAETTGGLPNTARVPALQNLLASSTQWKARPGSLLHAHINVLASMLKALTVALLVSLVASPVRARTVDEVENPRQSHAGWVTDEPHVLGNGAVDIEERLEALHQQVGAEVAWVLADHRRPRST